jgi:hypothetical protein
MQKERATCTLFIPVWKPAAYFSLICENSLQVSDISMGSILPIQTGVRMKALTKLSYDMC